MIKITKQKKLKLIKIGNKLLIGRYIGNEQTEID